MAAFATRSSAAGRDLARGLRQASAALAALSQRIQQPGQKEVLERLITDADAALFHAEQAEQGSISRPMLLAVLGGTGTGKSTLVNRLCEAPDYGKDALTATSFRRTFTAGPVAIAADPEAVPANWLGLPHVTIDAADLPARGRAGALLIVLHPRPVTRKLTLLDTPDLDGDTPDHHAQADRVFRWCEAVLFVTTPEKYQMTELLAYYRLAGRYGLPAFYVMNKTDSLAAAEDWQRQLRQEGHEATPYVVPRDDASFTAPAEASLEALRGAMLELKRPAKAARVGGLAARCGDLAGRMVDQLLVPLRRRRSAIESAKGRLESLVRPEPGVDVHPMTRQLQRRLQQQSVLYLMGPARVFDRIRSVPALVARLPRSAWDLLSKGHAELPDPTAVPEAPPAPPDFRSEMMDGLRLVQSRVSDVLSDYELGTTDGTWRLDPVLAGDIATSELDELRRWLEERWASKPRDTRLLEKMLKALPGSKHMAKASEAAPYLLAATCATTNVMFGPVDQVIIGGYLLTTWLTERVSNEVAGKTRDTNRRISQRFNDLCERQIDHAQAWLDAQAPSREQLDALETATEALACE